MFFSIIIPVYNVEKYLTKCVESIFAQTFTDYELILVDDGSTDNSGIICDSFAAKNKAVKVVHKPNGGASASRNAGVNAAQGEYIVFMDSDDYILSEHFLEKIHNKIGVSDILLYKHQKFIDGTTELLPCSYSYSYIKENDSYVDKVCKLVKNDAFYGMAWIKTIKRSLLTENGIQFEVGLVGEDMDWNYHLITHVSSIEVIDEPFIAYRQRANSVTTSLKLKNLVDFIYILQKWSRKVNEEIADETLKKALFGSMAKYYSNLLITYNRVIDDNKKQYIKEIKDLSWLLKYAMSKRPKMVAKIYRIFGFNLTVKALKIIDKK